MKNKKMLIIAAFCIICAALFIFFFIEIKFEKSEPLPAVMFVQGDENVRSTTVEFDGEWEYQRISPDLKTFNGQVVIDSLDFTKSDDLWETKIKFEPILQEEKRFLRGGYFLNDSRVRPIAHGLVYAGTELDSFYFYIGESELSGNSDYIIVAPAETKEEAYAVMESLGLDIPYIEEKFMYK